MSYQSAIQVLMTKDPETSTLNLYRANERSAKDFLSVVGTSSASFVEGICDIDEAHFATKWEIQALTEKLTGEAILTQPKDRLVAAKALAAAILKKLDAIPPAPTPSPVRIFPGTGKISPCRTTSKQGILLALLLKGTTLSEMMEATGWKEQSVLSGLNWDINKMKSIGYSVQEKDGVNVYKALIPSSFQGKLFV